MAKKVLPKYFGGISEKEVQEAADAAYAEYEAHMAQIRVKGSEIIDNARRQGKRIIVLAGRPYHVDPEVNHGIDHLITRHGAAVVTEDSISNRVEKFPHQRAEPVDLPQPPVCSGQILHHPEGHGSGAAGFLRLRRGCHHHRRDPRDPLQEGGKLYTQLKIDEITNLGAVNIRLRSLFAALDERDEDRR